MKLYTSWLLCKTGKLWVFAAVAAVSAWALATLASLWPEAPFLIENMGESRTNLPGWQLGGIGQPGVTSIPTAAGKHEGRLSCDVVGKQAASIILQCGNNIVVWKEHAVNQPWDPSWCICIQSCTVMVPFVDVSWLVSFSKAKVLSVTIFHSHCPWTSDFWSKPLLRAYSFEKLIISLGGEGYIRCFRFLIDLFEIHAWYIILQPKHGVHLWISLRETSVCQPPAFFLEAVCLDFLANWTSTSLNDPCCKSMARSSSPWAVGRSNVPATPMCPFRFNGY